MAREQLIKFGQGESMYYNPDEETPQEAMARYYREQAAMEDVYLDALSNLNLHTKPPAKVEKAQGRGMKISFPSLGGNSDPDFKPHNKEVLRAAKLPQNAHLRETIEELVASTVPTASSWVPDRNYAMGNAKDPVNGESVSMQVYHRTGKQGVVIAKDKKGNLEKLSGSNSLRAHLMTNEASEVDIPWNASHEEQRTDPLSIQYENEYRSMTGESPYKTPSIQDQLSAEQKAKGTYGKSHFDIVKGKVVSRKNQ